MAKKMALMDWYAMKYYHTRGLLLPVFVIFVGLFSSPLLVAPTSILLFQFFSLNPFAVEEKGALNNLYLTLPVSRNDIVSGRFILSGIMGLCGSVISIPIMLVINQFGWSHFYIPFSWYIFIFALSFFLFSLLNLATYPVLFKLGYNKGKFWGMVLPAIFMGIIYGAFTGMSHLSGSDLLILDVLEYAYQNMLLISGSITLLGVIFLMISYTLSKHIYASRDF